MTDGAKGRDAEQVLRLLHTNRDVFLKMFAFFGMQEYCRTTALPTVPQKDDGIEVDGLRNVVNNKIDEFIRYLQDELGYAGANELLEIKTELYSLTKATSYALLTSKVLNNPSYPELAVVEKGRVAQELAVVESGEGKLGSKAVAVVGLNYDGVELKTHTVITAYDRAVYNTVCTLWHAGNTRVTPLDIYRTMHGNVTRKATSAQIERINESIHKFMGTILTLDISDEIKKMGLSWNDERLVNGEIRANLLQAARITFKTENGRDLVGFRLYAEPVLYSYSKVRGQILTVPVELLDTTDVVSNTDDVVIVREYLIQQIQEARLSGNVGCKVRYSDIFEKTGERGTKSRMAAQRSRDVVKLILDSWVKRGFIGGYEEEVVKKRVEGLLIKTEYA